MSAFGGDMTVGLRLTARDDTQAALSKAQTGFSRFRSLVSRPLTVPLQIASGGLALLRDINLGLRPVLAGLDRMIERGAALETQQKAFGKFTQLGTRDSAGFARSLQQSALWTLRLGEALTVANRAMTTNIPREALDDLFKFAARRAAATGETTAGIIGGLVSGLGIGSARALKQFGLDIEHVADNYERIHGAGAFDQLPFAARQAMVLKAAMGEMRREVQLLRFSGREAIFSWKAIKTHIGDMTDKLFAAVARSDAMRAALGGVRDILAGITRHFERGGTFGELLLGKAGGKSGGLLGGVGAVFRDLGGFVGQGLRAGLGSIRELIGPITIEGLSELTSKIGSLAGEIRQAMIDGVAQFIADSRFGRWFFGADGGIGPGEVAATAIDATMKAGGRGTLEATGRGLSVAGRAWWHGLKRGIHYVRTGEDIGPLRGWSSSVAWEMRLPAGGGGGWSRSGDWMDDFREDFSGSVPPAAAWLRPSPGAYSLTPVARRAAMRQAAVLRWRMRQVEAGNFGVRQRALRAAGEEIAGLRREGYAIGPRQEREIRARHLADQTTQEMMPLRDRFEALRSRIGESDRRRRLDASESMQRRTGRESADAERREQRTADAAAQIAHKVDQLVALGQALLGAMVGGQAEIAKAR